MYSRVLAWSGVGTGQASVTGREGGCYRLNEAVVCYTSRGNVARRRRCSCCRAGKANLATGSPMVEQRDNWYGEESMGIILEDN